jgi:hypothetical protein
MLFFRSATKRDARQEIDMRKRTPSWLIAITTVLTLSVSAGAETVQVKFPKAVMLAKKSAGSDRVATLNRGDKLDVVAREDNWVKAKLANREGYVYENSLTSANDNLRKGATSLGTGLSAGEAGRGLASDQYAKSTGQSTAGLNRMLALRENVKGNDFDRFTAEGNVGPAKR